MFICVCSVLLLPFVGPVNQNIVILKVSLKKINRLKVTVCDRVNNYVGFFEIVNNYKT